ncbi:hypothetical protein [Mycetocola zhadangensis]|uniref:Uncharacterized protein n=1 Tax=Mycetocola zhadangensis TaxID=1164595 RepID=A0A3L7J122_9MICO|nr:hypothetical protein [Mycetocola zhadangensis]RLQ84167.1 hypothetical protein D9V28_08045 [Mycetocola zhadangensis]GGE95513.1 hypothetical protein GCM10011313_18140 [Mycetocola zhadangensis]
MAVKLNETAFRSAKKLVLDGKVVKDERDAWSEDAPTADEENGFIESEKWAEYSKWHLGVDDDHPDDTKGHYKFPLGDFRKVHRCAIISGESRAGQYNYDDIRDALGTLLEKIDAD